MKFVYIAFGGLLQVLCLVPDRGLRSTSLGEISGKGRPKCKRLKYFYKEIDVCGFALRIVPKLKKPLTIHLSRVWRANQRGQVTSNQTSSMLT